MDYQINKIEITSHNHGFSVDEDSLPEDVRVTQDPTTIKWLKALNRFSTPLIPFNTISRRTGPRMLSLQTIC